MKLIDCDNYPSDTDKELAYAELECPTLAEIQQEVLSWLRQNTNLLESADDKSYWHTIQGTDIVRACPKLVEYMKSIKTPIREIAIGVLTQSMQTGLHLHMDSCSLQTKINFPVLNTEQVYTEWYDIPIDVLNQLGIRDDAKTTDKVYNLYKIHDTATDYDRVARYNMHTKPIVFNSWIPHRVMPETTAQYPRVILSVMPVKELTHLLQK